MVEKFIMAGLTALHICDSQQGDKTIVLLHGYLESMHTWDDFVPLLTPHARVITLDLPGHGISVVEGEEHRMEYLADVVVEAIRSIGIKRFTVVGHSMGGYVALSICDRYADMLDGIVMLSSTPYADSDEKIDARRREIELVKSGKKSVLAKIAPEKRFAKSNIKRMRDYIDEVEQQIVLTEDEGVVAMLNGMISRTDKVEMLKNSSVRQLFILGRKDEHIPMDVAEKIVADAPQAKVVWLDESGHMGFWEQPEECAEAIVEFVGGLLVMC